MAYKNRLFLRQPEKLYLNELEREDGERAASLVGKEWGELKRELINDGVRRLLRQLGEQITAAPYEV
ncbi:hypothetical protein EO087_01760 [Dyella sp. M7H15-1]|uniref:hypothetical protein n=1 Tax=Dyella sp. M7H15-1 TaxID=2501295 RepID=UPI0010050211|nr:hypothetical protein [Dyella sp. M7H15-1]QAU22869.1 hypothetical protein EO087_01760 [Dyella sp. M7H15-1]